MKHKRGKNAGSMERRRRIWEQLGAIGKYDYCTKFSKS